ncbi:transglutaminase family protein [Microbacterium dextranolyticum]|uniref:Cysteine protease n=1 Tax=Microbacterium dextranolyticum TaxID=36806 RepID=A0A9W6HL70_9MICO|nr:transglutaminase domain-containing protein [Microbacterium dextranolyticum]MBM7464303.1 transglutaminase-like putative cysteine protease [Microbacterium dextranolyticum]GLJ95300.1 cysteine protease [Microbacterium dextranolyticum]
MSGGARFPFRRRRAAVPEAPETDRRHRDPRIVALDLAAAALLLAVSIVGFAPTFDSAQYLVAGVGGLALGLALAWAGAHWRWGVLGLAAATIGAYVVFGGALALPHTALFGVAPTLDTLQQLAAGVVISWKQLLTTVPPVAAADGHLVVPFILMLVGGVLTGSLALRARAAAWSLIPALAVLVATILLGVSRPAAPLVQGIVFAVVATVWLALRRTWDHDRAAVRVESAGVSDAASVRSSRTRRLVAGGLVLAVASGVGLATAAVATPPRYILRDFIVPPFDVTQYPSPLQSFRGYVRDDADTTLFTVSGLPKDARVRLATMDAYDGIVYNVSDDGAGSSSAFTPLRSNMSPTATGTPETVQVEIGDLTGVWVPDVGAVRDLAFDGARAAELTRSAYFNDATGTAAVPVGLAKGDSYTIDTLLPDQPSDAVLAGARFAALKMPKQTGIPEKIADLASKAVANAETPIERARALESYLHTQGFFSHGLGDDVVSLSGHGANRIMSLFSGEQMVGDDEQYAVAMALMATQLGMPARVVMGWHADDKHPQDGTTLTATGSNLHAWVEIAFQDYGWIPFDPTPDEDNKPNDQSTKPKANPKPQVLQPPPPAQEPADLPPAIAENRDHDDDQDPGLSWLGPVLLYGGITLGVLALLAAPFIVMGVIKGARRARRRGAARTADRISGGWDELVDSAVDLRAPVSVGATRAESAAVVGSTFDQPRVGDLATRADLDVFGPGDPAPEDVDAFWREVDDIVGQMRGSTSVWQRLRARLSLRSLRRGGSPWQGLRRSVSGLGASVMTIVRRGDRPRRPGGTESSDD